MDAKNLRQLEEAKALFYAWRLVEAYNIFRRYFDRLPFKPERAHAEYIGMFVRTLVELGKDYELKFYVSELERWHEKTRLPEIAYPLAFVYYHLSPPRFEASKALFEGIVKDPSARDFHPKAKMMLADYYSNKNDVASCRTIIDSIETSDPRTGVLLEIWKAFVLKRENRHDEAVARLADLLGDLKPDIDWYAYFSAKIILARLYYEKQDTPKAKMVVAEVKELFAGRQFKTVQHQLKLLEGLLSEEERMGTVSFSSGRDVSIFSYRNKSLQVKSKTPAEKLLLLLVKKKFLDKAIIVKSLYQRQYAGQEDDKLVYYHIHTLRKRLKTIGLPAEAIASEGSGYRLVPEVEIVGEDYEMV